MSALQNAPRTKYALMATSSNVDSNILCSIVDSSNRKCNMMLAQLVPLLRACTDLQDTIIADAIDLDDAFALLEN
jgi:hypothetical protein